MPGLFLGLLSGFFLFRFKPRLFSGFLVCLFLCDATNLILFLAASLFLLGFLGGYYRRFAEVETIQVIASRRCCIFLAHGLGNITKVAFGNEFGNGGREPFLSARRGLGRNILDREQALA